MAQNLTDSQLLIRLRWAAIGLGLLQTYSARYELYEDTISYLDVGDRFLRHDWQQALSSHWSPLYSWSLASWSGALSTSPFAEPPLLHVFGFAMYLGALFAFEYMFHGITCIENQGQTSVSFTSPLLRVPQRSVLIVSYPLFIWSALDLITISTPTPDFLVATSVLLSAGALARIKYRTRQLRNYLLFGLYLGFGYWSKNAMYPIAFVFLGTAIMVTWGRGVHRHLALATVVFAVLAAMLVIPLSLKKGRFTFGDSGRLNYSWHVNGVPHYCHWKGGDPRYGTPIHTTRQISTTPVIYEFGSPIIGTYPPWTDPSYWYEGVTPRFDLRQQFHRTCEVVREYFRRFFLRRSLITGVVVVLVVFGSNTLWICATAPSTYAKFVRVVSAMRDGWYLILPAAAGIGMYALVYMLDRYVAPFVLLLLIGLLTSIRITARWTEATRTAFLSVSVVLWMYLAVDAGRWLADTDDKRIHCTVAQRLTDAGLQPGDSVAHVGNSFDAYWARLGHVRIVAEIRPEDSSPFWTDPEAMTHALAVLRTHGAKVVVASHVANPGPGWNDLGNGDFWMLRL